jgi:NAD(P)-dependent dehydrogenase (short-subunit alcohol dehydrogenase family)
LTKAVLERGERVVATLRRPEVLSHLADKYTRNQLIVVPLDIRYPNQIDDAFDVVKSTFGRLDVVVNNGGHGLLGEVEGTDDATARNLFDVLLWGAVDISRKVRDP